MQTHNPHAAPPLSPTVLLTEDNEQLGQLLEFFLIEAGFRVVTAASGPTALKALEAEAVGCAALLTDIDLSSAVTGWDVARRARELNGNLPVVYMTGAHFDAWQQQGVARSVMLEKPFKPARMIEAITELINAALPR
jgi:CheY-like chemotaxis protein